MTLNTIEDPPSGPLGAHPYIPGNLIASNAPLRTHLTLRAHGPSISILYDPMEAYIVATCWSAFECFGPTEPWTKTPTLHSVAMQHFACFCNMLEHVVNLVMSLHDVAGCGCATFVVKV